MLICPSDPAPTTLVPIGGGNYAMHNYPMCTGSNDSVVQNPTGNLTGIVPNGVLSENSAISPAAITDGTSNTVAVSETLRSTNGSPTGVSSLTFFQKNPLSGFVITGDNAMTGPAIASDADDASLCLTEG